MRIWIGIIFALLFASVAQAQTLEALPLTLDDAIARGLMTSHRIEEASARRDAAAAVADQRPAAAPPKPDLLAGYTHQSRAELCRPRPSPDGFLAHPTPNNYTS
jgi:outer membrane protein TolC